MSFDDRVRDAYRRQLDDATQRNADASFTDSGPSPLRRAGPLVVCSLVLLAGFFALTRSGRDTTIDASDRPPPAETTVGPATSADSENTVTTPPTTPPTTLPTTAPVTADENDGGDPTDTDLGAAGTAATSPAPGDGRTPSSSPGTTTGAGPEPDRPTTTTSTPVTSSTPAPQTVTTMVGSPSAACPSGRRAPLESARLRYLSDNKGWNRLDDLVDEQDARYTYEAWEPNYPNEVTVEVVFGGAVQAADIRVAQDPFTPVSGEIEFTVSLNGAPQRSFTIPLAGTDGWVPFVFDQPLLIDGFTITRNGERENIMEVLVCTTS